MAEKTLLEYWLILYSKRVFIVVVTFSAILTAGILSKILPPVYEAKAVFFVPEEPDTTTFLSPPGGTTARSPLIPSASDDPNAPYIGILKSKTIADLVQKEFPHKNLIDLLRRDMDFALSDEYMIEIYARDRNSQTAADIANAYVKYFRQLMGGYSLNSQADRKYTIEGEITHNQQRLFEAQEVLNTFQQKNKSANLDEEIKQLISMKTTFESQLETLRIEYIENKNKIVTTRKKLKEEVRTLKTSEIAITSPLLEKLRSQLVDVEAKMSSLRIEIKEAHPEYMTWKGNYDEVKNNINKEVERIIKSQIKAPDTFYENLRRQLISLYVEREGVEAGIEGTVKTLKEIEDRIREIPTIKIQLDNLVSAVERYKKLIETLNMNLEEVKSQTKRDPQVAVLVEEATPPSRPSFPILWLNTIVACLAGLMGGIVYCFFLNYLEETKEKRIYRLWKAIETTKDDG